MAEAQTEEWATKLANPTADRHLLLYQPGVLLNVPDVHRAAHHPQRVIAVERWNRLSLIKLDSAPLDTILLQMLPELPRMFAIDMLENEKAHGELQSHSCLS